MSHPRSSKQQSSVSSTDSSESNYSESSYSPSPRNSVDHTQAPVRGPPRGSTHPTDPQAFYGRPCGRTMLDAFATAGRASASTADVPPSRRRARVSFSVEDELRFYSPSHPPNKFLKPRMVGESILSHLCDEPDCSRLSSRRSQNHMEMRFTLMSPACTNRRYHRSRRASGSTAAQRDGERDVERVTDSQQPGALVYPHVSVPNAHSSHFNRYGLHH